MIQNVSLLLAFKSMHTASVVHLMSNKILDNSEPALHLCMVYVYMKDSDLVKHNLAFVRWWEGTAHFLVVYGGILCVLFMCDREDNVFNIDPLSYD